MRDDLVAIGAPSATFHLDRLEARFRSASPVFRGAVGRQHALFGHAWAHEFDDLIGRLLFDDDALAAAVDGYTRLALDGLRLQRRFDATGAYEPKVHDEVIRDVYLDDAYMRTSYLPGLLLAHYLWPHHYRQVRFFERAFLHDRMLSAGGDFYDVGVGTGSFSRLALMEMPQAHGVGIDISPASLAYADAHVRAYGVGDRYRVELGDVVTSRMEPVGRMICVEVLEHLENPLGFIRALRRLLTPGGAAFIATAINAPNADHIYLYRTAAEVARQLSEGGFVVEEYFCALAGTSTTAGGSVPEVAAFIVT